MNGLQLIAWIPVLVSAAVAGSVGDIAQRPKGATMSIGGTDLSRTGAGVQARWQHDGETDGLFVGGKTTFERLAAGDRPTGDGAFVLAIAARNGSLDSYVWTPRLERTFRNAESDESTASMTSVRELFARAATRFEGLESSPSGVTPVARATSGRVRGSGATLTGLPATSEDSASGVIQAGWLDDLGRRNGVFARGRWHVQSGGTPASDVDTGWLVAFTFDPADSSVTIWRALMTPRGLENALWSDGEHRLFDEGSRAWSVEIVRAIERFRTGE